MPFLAAYVRDHFDWVSMRMIAVHDMLCELVGTLRRWTTFYGVDVQRLEDHLWLHHEPV